MIDYTKSNTKFASIAIIFIMVLLMTRCFKYVGWNLYPKLASIRYLALFSFPLFFFFKCHFVTTDNLHSKNIVYYCIITCFSTFILRNIVYGGGLGYGLESNIFFGFIFFTYFLLHYSKIPEKILIQSITIIGLVVLFIQVYQQIYPELALFSTLTDEMRDEMELADDWGMRNGLYRYKPIAQAFPFFLYCYYLTKMLTSYTNKYFFLVVAFSASTYLMLTRMFLLSMLIAGIFIYLNCKKKKNVRMSFLLFSTVVILFVFSDVLFSNIFSVDESDIVYSSSIRMEAMSFFFNRLIDDPLLFFLGHGYPNHLWRWGGLYGFWYNDLGVIGQVYIYGVVWLFVYVFVIYWLLIAKRYTIPLYIRAYIIGMFSIFYMMPLYSSLILTFLFCVVLYISDLYINNEGITENNII